MKRELSHDELTCLLATKHQQLAMASAEIARLRASCEASIRYLTKVHYLASLITAANTRDACILSGGKAPIGNAIAELHSVASCAHKIRAALADEGGR